MPARAAAGRGRAVRTVALAVAPAVVVGVAWTVVAHGAGRGDLDPPSVAPVPAADLVEPAPVAAPAVQDATVVAKPSPEWVAATAARTGIPGRALLAYAGADLTVRAEDPGCGIGWTTLAGIGAVESDHGRHGGSAVGPDGIDRPTVLGPALDGTAGNRAVPDTDGGRLDGDATWDRAVGPLQFIPTTWATWGRSATGGVPDPSDVDDAALTAAAYLCAAGTDMTTAPGWTAAIATYNAPPEYAVAVASAANDYAAAVSATGATSS